MTRTYITIAFIFIVGSVIAQPIRSNTFEQKVDAAQRAESTYNFGGALEWYESAYADLREDKSRDAESRDRKTKFALKVADMCYTVRDYEKAAKYYKRVLDKDDEGMFSDYMLSYGKTLKALAEYDDAVGVLNQFIADTDVPELKEEAQFELDGIMTLRGMEPNLETSIQLVKLGKGIKTGSSEFSPRQNPADGNLYFGSLNRNDKIEVSGEEDDFHAKIYMAEKEDNGEYGKVESVSKTINREDFHSSNVAFTRDGRTMYFTRVQTTGTEITSSQIYVSYNINDKWSAADPVAKINGDWNNKQPAVGQLYGKEVLFFCSDMPGGSGGMDIYYANILGDGNFSSPVNLGEKINTVKDDLCPFYYDGTLYYSTDGRPTIGGFDIFYTDWDGAEWSRVKNLGFQYNTSFDDLYYTRNNDGRTGYFMSNRPTEGKKKLRSKTCCDDIFAYSIKEVVIDLLAEVVDERDSILTGANVKLVNISDPKTYPEDSKYNALGNQFSFGLDADYKYKAVVTRDGYYPDSIFFNTAGIIDDYTVNKTISLKPQPKEPEFTEEIEIVTINQPIRMNNIYYDFDDYKILQDAEKDLYELLGLMNKYSDMVIELSSHTDAQGITRYNKELSQKRAESATNWLIKKGIDASRIKPVGYGESIILNHCKNGVKCSDDEHRVNRRTEFRIIAGPQSIEIKREVKKKVVKE